MKIIRKSKFPLKNIALENVLETTFGLLKHIGVKWEERNILQTIWLAIVAWSWPHSLGGNGLKEKRSPLTPTTKSLMTWINKNPDTPLLWNKKSYIKKYLSVVGSPKGTNILLSKPSIMQCRATREHHWIWTSLTHWMKTP